MSNGHGGQTGTEGRGRATGRAGSRGRLLESRLCPSSAVGNDRASKPPILAQSAAAPPPGVGACARSRRAVARGRACSALSGVAAFGLAPGTTLDTVAGRRRSSARSPLPALAAARRRCRRRATGARSASERGDTIGSVLARLGVDDPEALAFLRTDPAARPLYQLRPGKPLRSRPTTTGRSLDAALPHRRRRAAVDRARRRRLRRDVGARRRSEVRWEMAAGEIRSSLFAAADAAGLPDAVTLQLADVFAGDIDFYHDLQRGDRFAVVYEMRYVDGEPVGAGPHRRRRVRAIAARRSARSSGATTTAARTTTPTTARRCARRSCARRWSSRASRRASRNARFHPILQTGARTRASTTRRPIGHAGARDRQRHGRASPAAGRLRQRDPCCSTRARSRRSMRICRASRRSVQAGRARGAGRGDRLRRPDRLGDRPAPALRVPRRRRAARSADASRCRAASRFAPPARPAFAERIAPAAAQLALARDASPARSLATRRLAPARRRRHAPRALSPA